MKGVLFLRRLYIKILGLAIVILLLLLVVFLHRSGEEEPPVFSGVFVSAGSLGVHKKERLLAHCPIAFL